ncbi:MAG TPA: hypothetical protein VFE26_13550 [Trebonia sp.]|jgi:hypothetical protein|nr:hypothetical protein [Trebonia sp.]
MSTVYTKRFLGQQVSAGQTVYAAPPAGKVWIIRNIIANGGGSSSATEAAIFAPYPLTVAVALQAANAQTNYNAETRIVVEDGERLGVSAFVGAWYVTITGYEFDAA